MFRTESVGPGTRLSTTLTSQRQYLYDSSQNVNKDPSSPDESNRSTSLVKRDYLPWTTWKEINEKIIRKILSYEFYFLCNILREILIFFFFIFWFYVMLFWKCYFFIWKNNSDLFYGALLKILKIGHWQKNRHITLID